MGVETISRGPCEASCTEDGCMRPCLPPKSLKFQASAPKHNPVSQHQVQHAEHQVWNCQASSHHLLPSAANLSVRYLRFSTHAEGFIAACTFSTGYNKKLVSGSLSLWHFQLHDITTYWVCQAPASLHPPAEHSPWARSWNTDQEFKGTTWASQEHIRHWQRVWVAFLIQLSYAMFQVAEVSFQTVGINGGN